MSSIAVKIGLIPLIAILLSCCVFRKFEVALENKTNGDLVIHINKALKDTNITIVALYEGEVFITKFFDVSGSYESGKFFITIPDFIRKMETILETNKVYNMLIGIQYATINLTMVIRNQENTNSNKLNFEEFEKGIYKIEMIEAEISYR